MLYIYIVCIYKYTPLGGSSNSEVYFDFCMIWGHNVGGAIWSPTMKLQKNKMLFIDSRFQEESFDTDGFGWVDWRYGNHKLCKLERKKDAKSAVQPVLASADGLGSKASSWL